MVEAARYRIGRAFYEPSRGLLVDAAGGAIALRAQSMKVLLQLLAQAGAVATHEQLRQAVWAGVVVTDDSLVQCISDIRRAIADPRHEVLRTVARRGYLLDVAVPAPAPALSASPVPRPPAAAAEGGFGARPALAVLEFRCEPADDASGLGRSMAEELIGTLARDVDLPVVSGRSSFLLDARELPAPAIAARLRVRYLVDGVVRREGDAVLLQVELVDGGDGRIVWVDRSRATVRQLARRRTALVARIAGSLEATMRLAEKRKALSRPAATLDAYALTLRGYAGKHCFTPDAYHRARADLLQALRLDPGHAPAWAVLGYLDGIDANNQITGDIPAQGLRQALAHIEHAIALDPLLPLAHQAHAVMLGAAGCHARALEAARQALRLAPGDADNLTVLAKALNETGHGDEAIARMDQALALYPILPVYIAYWDTNIRWAARDFDAALRSSAYCLERAPRYLLCRTTRAVALLEMGRADEARAEAHVIRQLAPALTAEAFIGSLGGVPDLRERRLRAWRQLWADAG